MAKMKELAVSRRRQQILDMMLEGETKKDILAFYKQRYPELSKHNLDKDITWAYKEMKNYVDFNGEAVVNEHANFYDTLAKNCKEIGDAANAIKAKQAKEKILGLHKPDVAVQVNNNTQNNTFIPMDQLTFEQLQAIVNGKQGDSHQIGT